MVQTVNEVFMSSRGFNISTKAVLQYVIKVWTCMPKQHIRVGYVNV